MEIKLRPWQLEAKEALRRGAREGHRCQLLVAPTGGGKSVSAIDLIQGALELGSKVAFVCDRVVLVDQFCDDYLVPMRIDHGVIMSDHWRDFPQEKLQICSVQTLEKREMAGDFDLVVVDEAHCLRGKFSDYMKRSRARFIGLTATPFNKGLAELYTSLVNVTTTNQLIKEGFLVPLKVYVAKAVDMTGAETAGGEWTSKAAEKRGTEIIGDIVAEWEAKTREHFGGPVKTIVFSATVAHGDELCQAFQKAGYNFQQISYKSGNTDEKKRLTEEFKKSNSEIMGLISCEVLTKGFDCKDVLCGISARPYRKSFSSHVQQLGRLMRSSPGKTFGLWMDHSGNYMRFLDDMRDLFLNGVKSLAAGDQDAKIRKEPTEKEKKQNICSCGAVMPAFAKKCPACGKEKPAISLVETLPGEMVEIDPDAGMKPYLRDRAHVWAQLTTYAFQKKTPDRRSAYCIAKWQQWYGCFPKHSYAEPALLTPMSTELGKRIQAENIKYVKTQQAARRHANG